MVYDVVSGQNIQDLIQMTWLVFLCGCFHVAPLEMLHSLYFHFPLKISDGTISKGSQQ